VCEPVDPCPQGSRSETTMMENCGDFLRMDSFLGEDCGNLAKALLGVFFFLVPMENVPGSDDGEHG